MCCVFTLLCRLEGLNLTWDPFVRFSIVLFVWFSLTTIFFIYLISVFFATQNTDFVFLFLIYIFLIHPWLSLFDLCFLSCYPIESDMKKKMVMMGLERGGSGVGW